jgi:hypothetical protein
MNPVNGRSERMKDTMRSVAHREKGLHLLIINFNSECYGHSRQCLKTLFGLISLRVLCVFSNTASVGASTFRTSDLLKHICSVNQRTSHLVQATLRKKNIVQVYMNFPLAYEYLKYVEDRI